MFDPLAVEKQYLDDHRHELIDRYPGKFLVIKGAEVFGGYDSYDEGVAVGVRLFGSGPFLVRNVMQTQDAEAPRIPALAVGVPLRANH